MSVPALPLAKPSERAIRFWTSVHTEYDLTPKDEEIVLGVCRVLTTLDRLQDVIDNLDSPITTGSHGDKPHPAITESRAQLAVMERLLSRLPFEVEEP